MNRRKNTAVRKQNFADVSLSPNITPYEKTTKALFKDQFYPAESPDPVPRLCSVSSKSSFSSINLVNDDCSKEGIDGSCNVDKHRTTISSKQDKPILQDENVELKAKLSRFMTKRMMTPLQERMNAVTVGKIQSVGLFLVTYDAVALNFTSPPKINWLLSLLLLVCAYRSAQLDILHIFHIFQ
mmetsp:Transcript_34097/g.78710  ORF Transcript_34097/g.78710 Transcript_34097/m.78710 type:complete len:183 (-) Transcript_34097:862-1410(-)